MARWTAFPEPNRFDHSAASVKKAWATLHKGDAEPLPRDEAVLQAWAHYHNGEFQKAAELGLKAGGDGITVANKATAIYATYLEKKDSTRLALFMEVAERAKQQAADDPKNANAWYWQAYALGRYGQGISVVKALAQGLGTQVKEALEETLALAPKHADAHIALGSFHAEVVDKVGAMIAKLTYGAKKETAFKMYQDALKLNPQSPVAMVEYANGMVMLEGDKRMKEATALYEKAAAIDPLDAMEWLDVDGAQKELEDE